MYDMARRITELVNRREQALSLLARAPADVYVRGAIVALRDEPWPGEEGGPARDAVTQYKNSPLRNTQSLRAPPSPAPPPRPPARVRRRAPKPTPPPKPTPTPKRATVPAQGVPAVLTEREWQVARLAAAGLTNKQIGDALDLSRHTIHSHLTRITGRCKVHNRTQLAAWVQRHDPEHVEDV